MDIDNMTTEQLREATNVYFTRVIEFLKEADESSSEYQSCVDDLESMSDKMSEESFDYLKLKVVY